MNNIKNSHDASLNVYPTDHLIDYFSRDKSLHYNVPNIDFLMDRFDETTHAGGIVIKKLLASLEYFIYETQSQWNKTGTEERLRDVLNQMAEALQEFQNDYPKIVFSDHDDATTFQSALMFSKNCILNYIDQDKSNHSLYAIYNNEQNELKTILNRI